MTEKILKSICWDITSKCNDSCPFCYRNQNNNELSIDDNKKIIKKLLEFGVGKISFVGGEPLLYKGLDELVKYGRSIDNSTLFSVTTNAILLTGFNEKNDSLYVNENELARVINNFDWITFSLDSNNKKKQFDIGRNKLHFDRILLLLNYLKAKNYNNKIKINTVVNALNIDDIVQLYDFLVDQNIKRWKLFRFLPSRGNAKQNKDKYEISGEDFDNLKKALQKKNEKQKIKISYNNHDDFKDTYVTITSNGKVVVYEQGRYIEKIDLTKENLGKIVSFINIEKHKKRRFDYNLINGE